jgi:prolyl-tRNA editing enzyme YbaK/EbsC (Cys-tRNA(Pro) deacylase)
MEQKSSAPDRVRAALAAAGVQVEIRQFDTSTRTAEDAALAIGTTVGQIVKSLVFVSGGRPVLALMSGSNQLELASLAALTGQEVGKADASLVRAATGYSIGGVPPLGFPQPIETYIDRDLFKYEEIWAAAGTPNHVFRTTPAALIRLTSATAAELKRQSLSAET